jgi:Leucine-rich repeat (LRR) protein
MPNLAYLKIARFDDYGKVLTCNGYPGPLYCLSNLEKLEINTLSMRNQTNRRQIENGQFFYGLTSLTSLVIESFKKPGSKSIKQDMFKHLHSLKHLELHNHFLKMVEPDAFILLSNLKHLDIFSCKLSQFPFVCLTNCLANLEHLSLTHAKIDSLDGLCYNGTLPYMPSRLRVLDFVKNKISMPLPMRAFFNLPCLVNLNLYNSRIKAIETGAFDGLINMRSLNLSYNVFDTFDFGALFFENATNGSRGPMPVNLILLNISSLIFLSIRAPETSTVKKCCFRNQVYVDVSAERLSDRSGLDILIERGLIQLKQ